MKIRINGFKKSKIHVWKFSRKLVQVNNGCTHRGIYMYTQSPLVDPACVLIPLRKICDFSVFSKVWNSKQKKPTIQTIIYHYHTKDGKKSCSSHQNAHFTLLKFYDTHIHKHNWLSLLHRNGSQNIECLVIHVYQIKHKFKYAIYM